MAVFEKFKAEWKKNHAGEDYVSSVAAIKTLIDVIKNSTATTMMELEIELKCASDYLRKFSKSSISLMSGCELYLRTVTRSVQTSQYKDFNDCKINLLGVGETLVAAGLAAVSQIARYGDQFINDGMTVLTNGYDRVVSQLLIHSAASKTKHFNVVVTETRPNGSGYKMAKVLSDAGIKVIVILDCAVAYSMSKVDMVLVGAEGLVENGGIINRIGTYQIALVAKAHKKPFYVAAESYKFARMFPLYQTDLPEMKEEQRPWKPLQTEEPLPEATEVDNPSQDYTPPNQISLLFTDLGVLTPSAGVCVRLFIYLFI